MKARRGASILIPVVLKFKAKVSVNQTKLNDESNKETRINIAAEESKASSLSVMTLCVVECGCFFSDRTQYFHMSLYFMAVKSSSCQTLYEARQFLEQTVKR